MSPKTLIWGALVRIVSGYHPSLYSCQKSLPFMPVPSLRETLNRFLLSIEPLYGKDSIEYRKFKTLAQVSLLHPKSAYVLLVHNMYCIVCISALIMQSHDDRGVSALQYMGQLAGQHSHMY